MQTLNLKFSTSLNQALNQDGVTLLRSLSLTQDNAYTVNLAFYDDTTAVTPSIGAFSFKIRTTDGTDIISVNSITSQAGAYPYYFTFTNSSPALTNALGTSLYVDMLGVLSYEDSGEIEVIEPFTVRVFSTQATGSQVAFVSTLNGLSSDLTIAGTGSITVSTTGQTISIGGSFYPLLSNPSGYITSSALVPYLTTATAASTYYPLTNPSGYITSSALSSYLTTATAASTYLTSANAASTYYPLTNPSAYITSSALSPYLTSTSAASTYYPLSSNPAGYLTSIPSDVVRTTGTQSIGGSKTFTALTAFNNDIKSDNIKTMGGNTAIGVSSHVLNDGHWVLATADSRYIATEPWHSYVTLTKIIAAVPDSPATGAHLTFNESDFGSVFDGQVFTVSVGGSTITFEWDNDANVTGGNYAVTLGSNQDDNLNNFINILQSSFSNPFTVNSDGYTLSLTTATGSSQSVAFSGQVGSTDYTQSSSGTDDVPGTPESGTRFASLQSGIGGYYNRLLSVTIVVADTAWTSTGIEIGYFDGTNFNVLAAISQPALTAGVHNFFVDLNFPSADSAALFHIGSTVSIVARSGSGGSPADESSGGDATIYARGYYSLT